MQTHRSNLDCTTLRLRQPWEELVPWEGTPWHWSKHLNFRNSWLFHKDYLSLRSCQTSILPHEWLSKPLLTLKWDHPTFEMSLRFFELSGFFGDHGVSLWNSSSGILGVLVCDQNWENDWKKRESGIGHRFWDFPSLCRVLASHDRRYNESNIGGFNGCSHVGTVNSAYWVFSTFEMHG